MIIFLLIFGLGLLANLGLPAGEWLEDRLGDFGFIGYFVAVSADFIRILMPIFVGFIVGVVAASFGSRYGQEAILNLSVAPARIATSVLAAGGTAVLIYGLGSGLNWLYQYDNPEYYTTIPAAVGAAVMAVVGYLIAPKRPFKIGFVIYTISRSILNALRSIEPLILGIVFVVWVSLGPFAGVMALTLHSIAALGKLFSEQVEGISEGPIEAITATGANRLQMIVFAVVPQIIPPFTAFTFYRWDINVRMSTIIGFVGGGGIGFVLAQNIQQLRYRQASVMMLSIAIVVATLDYASSKIRSRII
jgi:phosphonate ABC transporter permease subunit PhnE